MFRNRASQYDTLTFFFSMFIMILYTLGLIGVLISMIIFFFI